uniref:F-box domain-containing protein n=1 Tax=Oryza nivara TaxID=4536 RepID=A0A0E0FV57_ORYNI
MVTATPANCSVAASSREPGDTEESMAKLLPDDVLTIILRCPAPHDLAMSRCVCKLWCTIIDTHRMLRVDLLPHSVGGIFINFHDLGLSEFFARPSTGPTISGNINYLPLTSIVRGHCNGLLLLYSHISRPGMKQFYVVNPATRQWVQLPPPPRPDIGIMHLDNLYLAFDPTLSSHFEGRLQDLWLSYDEIFQIFCTMLSTVGEYFIISLSDGKYRIIKPPVEIERYEESNIYMGLSQKRVYCTFFDDPDIIYILDESYGEMEWVQKNAISCLVIHAFQQTDGPWTLQDITIMNILMRTDMTTAIEEQNFDWDSDNDNFINTTDERNLRYGRITFLGFHPYKEVVFSSHSLSRGLAYHLNTMKFRGFGKIQDLGNLGPKYYGGCMGIQPFIEESFLCTPWMGEFPKDIN